MIEINNPIREVLASGRRGESWWITFDVDIDEEGINGFCGEILHIHLATPEDWKEIANDYLNWITAVGGVVGAVVGGTTGIAIAAIPVLAGMISLAKNRDGSFDFFYFYETKNRRIWKNKFSPFFPLLRFQGFVSDQRHKGYLPFSILPGNFLIQKKFLLTPLSVIDYNYYNFQSLYRLDIPFRSMLRARSLAYKFRNSPNPN